MTYEEFEIWICERQEEFMTEGEFPEADPFTLFLAAHPIVAVLDSTTYIECHTYLCGKRDTLPEIRLDWTMVDELIWGDKDWLFPETCYGTMHAQMGVCEWVWFAYICVQHQQTRWLYDLYGKVNRLEVMVN